LLYDPSGIHHKPTRTDIKVVPVEAMEAMMEINNPKAYNMIMLGALLAKRPVVSLDDVLRGLKKTLPERHHHLLPLNEQALRRGMQIVSA
ncbi:MAG: 2-oxoacid:acceptor oxidoreductase family protein, partial [Muribaculaceae bacterium]|nr:2-oxoacid:acceptor oxidoreductase family protein [Muribaculaceae bacterium]